MGVKPRIESVAVAGRRYPWAAAGRVRDALALHLQAVREATLVTSAAAGTDLVALALARDLGMPRRIVLPSAPAVFRAGSVVDRHEEQWGKLFDELAIGNGSDLVLVGSDLDSADPYLATNEEILRQALLLAGTPAAVLALLVWDSKRRQGTDYSAEFCRSAQARGIRVIEQIVAL